MSKVYYSFLVLFYFVMVSVLSQQVPPSPCPKIFSYENIDTQWFGLINIPNPEFDEMVILSVTLSINVKLPTSYVGRIELLGENRFNIKYRVHFPLPNILPVVTSIVFNEKEFCYGRPNPAISTTTIHLRHRYTKNTRTRPVETRPEDDTYKQENSNLNREDSNVFVKPTNDSLIFFVDTQAPQNYPSESARKTTSSQFDEQTEKYDRLKYRNRIKNTSATTNIDPNIGYERPNPDILAERRPPNSNNSPSNIKLNYLQSICGRATIISNGLVVNGETTQKGEWPWLAALYVKKLTGLNYICGGSLILDNLVVTAAHCVINKDNRPVKKEDFLIKLGAFNLDHWADEEVKNREVNEVILHPSYEAGVGFNGDIALLKFNSISFTDRIKPVCLWSGNDDLSLIVGSLGTVIGWGNDENGMVTSEPRQTKVPIVSTEVCRGSRIEFFRTTSNTTLCAGNKDGSGPCNGDSGSGLYLYDDTSSHWALRGIVSNSLIDPNSLNRCNLNEYIVFTDSAKYIRWIQSYMWI